MRVCNKCEIKRYDWMFKNNRKKTCLKCEYSFWQRVLRFMVRSRELSPIERISSRVGYMGAGFLMAGQWTVEPILFMIGFCCVLFQVTVRKQWNLVILQLNGLTAWTIHFFSNL
jgi:hypothetical protein